MEAVDAVDVARGVLESGNAGRRSNADGRVENRRRRG